MDSRNSSEPPVLPLVVVTTCTVLVILQNYSLLYIKGRTRLKEMLEEGRVDEVFCIPGPKLSKSTLDKKESFYKDSEK